MERPYPCSGRSMTFISEVESYSNPESQYLDALRVCPASSQSQYKLVSLWDGHTLSKYASLLRESNISSRTGTTTAPEIVPRSGDGPSPFSDRLFHGEIYGRAVADSLRRTPESLLLPSKCGCARQKPPRSDNYP